MHHLWRRSNGGVVRETFVLWKLSDVLNTTGKKKTKNTVKQSQLNKCKIRFIALML